ncbi:MAG: endopeptidase La [Clostridia bacterium]|nr:endopeptidase La [Clostridia bacterium]
MEEKTNQEIIESVASAGTVLPMVALRGKVIFPGVVTSFDVGRQMSLAAIDVAANNNMDIFIATQKDIAIEAPTSADIFTVGVVCRIRQIVKMPGNNARVSVQGMYRARIENYLENSKFFEVEVERLYLLEEDPALVEANLRVAQASFKEYVAATKLSKEVTGNVENITDPAEFTDTATFYMHFKEADKQAILEENSVIGRLKRFDELLAYELEIANLEKKISSRVRQSIDKSQKEYYLREQLRAIHAELGDDEEEREELRRSIVDKNMPKEVEEKALKELSKMDKMMPSSPEYTVIRNYFDWLLDLPFNEQTEDTEDLKQAIKILNEDHYGLEKVKERIVEYLAVLKLTQKIRGPILCFVGPPGVGKTSIARSIARALGRKFVRMSLGGVKDEAEIRGHRRTYIGAMPGRIIYAMKDAGSINPVFLLDEIDKISMDLRGDPASALLEVLDPEQNSTFRDRFLEIPYDLSKVLFITTANSLDTIPAPLLDRMEVIRLSGYTLEEKMQIAKQYLIGKQTEANGLTEKNIKITDDALREVIDGYTREAGVRTLEREIGSLCRKVATKVATNSRLKKQVITEERVADYLGARKFFPDEALASNEVGAVTGLAWTAVGGTTLTVECTLIRGKGDIILTGQLGDVMKESARAAISYIRSKADKYNIDMDKFDHSDVHIHVPEGATPKDGPSAGITIATAILSAFTGREVKKSVAMTGEITLRGKVLPIGGLKEKALAAYRLGIRHIVIPKANVKDLDEIPANIREEIKFVPVADVDEVFAEAFVKKY